MGCVGGRVVCVCELIKPRCVFVRMYIRAGGWGSVLGEGGRLSGVVCGVKRSDGGRKTRS